MKPTKKQLFYFDCEWVPVVESYFNLKMDFPLLADAFEHQVEKWKDKELEEGRNLDGKDYDYWWDKKAHFYPELCRIICVSYGFYSKEKEGELDIRSVYGDDEKKIMETMANLFARVHKAGYYLCGYAIKRFDMPWLGKRMMVNGVKPPENISVYGKKPWEVEVFDLPEVWGQGNMQESFTPFELACNAIGMESSKDDLSGSKVKEAYFAGEIERIKDYCEKDVQKIAELAVKYIDLLF